MTKYDVYALGNALLDTEFEVSPETLEKLGIEKGVMTLLDRDAQDKIVESLAEYDTKRSCGGSAANTLIAISQFGGKAFYSCKVANDEPGKFYTKDLLDCGVATNLDTQVADSGVTGKCLVFVTPDADRTMNTFLGISGNFSDAELIPEAIANAEYTYIEGYLVSGENSKQAAIKAKEIAQAAEKKVAFTLADFNMVKFFKSGLLEIIGDGVDFLFANEGEALLMADTEDFDTAVEHLKTLAKGFAITRGATGSVIFDGEKLIEIEPFPVKAIDTVGAGDMYAGAFLYGITNGMSYEEAGRLASKASSKIVTSLGARLKTEEVRGLLN
ncbi:adenosine kinase [Waterburya agarophytonicola K14]|uniref:Adenosine kinase n=1 Tax=Waterburya agarophytonicola KI4 TaxID=2874699 RepID=A0A964BP04_9CYAN|nr:adenosine kinase [Waterburya agarophytonicola]MCC0176928.1 adenosine kinase [Waterburya agarophytonicola KI4]